MNLIKEKKQVFNDLRIPWNKEIEQTFKREKKNSVDPEKHGDNTIRRRKLLFTL